MWGSIGRLHNLCHVYQLLCKTYHSQTDDTTNIYFMVNGFIVSLIALQPCTTNSVGRQLTLCQMLCVIQYQRRIIKDCLTIMK